MGFSLRSVLAFLGGPFSPSFLQLFGLEDLDLCGHEEEGLKRLYRQIYYLLMEL